MGKGLYVYSAEDLLQKAITLFRAESGITACSSRSRIREGVLELRADQTTSDTRGSPGKVLARYQITKWMLKRIPNDPRASGLAVGVNFDYFSPMVWVDEYMPDMSPGPFGDAEVFRSTPYKLDDDLTVCASVCECFYEENGGDLLRKPLAEMKPSGQLVFTGYTWDHVERGLTRQELEPVLGLVTESFPGFWVKISELLDLEPGPP